MQLSLLDNSRVVLGFEMTPQVQEWFEFSKRISLIALRFIALHPRLGRPIGACAHVFMTLDYLKQAHKSDNWQSMIYAMAKAILAAATVLVCLVKFTVVAFGVMVASMIFDFVDLCIALREKDSEKIFESISSICFSSLIIASLLLGHPEIALAAFIIELIIEIQQSHKEFNQGHELEGYGHLLFGSVRGFQEIPTCSKACNKYF